MASAPPEIQALQKEFVKLGEDLQKLATDRQQLVIQLNENEGVLIEMGLLSSEAELFRSVGSALVRMETGDVKSLVTGRVDMIKKEMSKIEQLVQDKGNRRLEIQSELQKYQQEQLQKMQKAGPTGTPVAGN